MVKRLTQPAMTKNMRTKCVDSASFNEDPWSGDGEESYNLYTFFVLKSSFNEYLRERKLSEML